MMHSQQEDVFRGGQPQKPGASSGGWRGRTVAEPLPLPTAAPLLHDQRMKD